MSPLWRDKVLIALSPERVVLLRLRRGLRPQRVANTVIAVPPGAADVAWKAPVEALARLLLASKEWQDADVSVVLSNHFARYQLVPWSEAVTRREERDAYVREVYAQVYGEGAGEWALRVSETGIDAPWLACAVDRALLDQIEEAVTHGKGKLVSVMPHLMSVFNAMRSTLRARDAWFVQVERGRLLLGLILNGQWQALSSRQIAGDGWHRELPLLLEREAQLKGLTHIPRGVYVSAPEAQQAVLDGAGKWVYRWLRPKLGFGLSGLDDAPYAMVLGA